jgi:hypothetical protein
LPRSKRWPRRSALPVGWPSRPRINALDEQAVDGYVDAVAEKAGGMDISFNLISYEDVQGTPLAEMSLEDFERPIVNAARTHEGFRDVKVLSAATLVPFKVSEEGDTR